MKHFILLFFLFFTITSYKINVDIAEAATCTGTAAQCWYDKIRCSKDGSLCGDGETTSLIGTTCGTFPQGTCQQVTTQGPTFPCQYIEGMCTWLIGTLNIGTGSCEWVTGGSCYWQNTTTPDPSDPPGDVCTWCTNQANCLASGCSWGGTSTYCSAAGDGCCNCASSGGGGSDGNCCHSGSWVSSQPGSAGFTDCNALIANGGPDLWPSGWTACRNHACGIPECTCTPNCPVLCGQSNGCGGNCATTDDGAPGAITFISPVNNIATMNGNNLTLSWAASTKAEIYQYQIYPQGSNCTSPYAHCGSQAGTSYTFTPDPNGGNQYFILVIPINTTCSVDMGAVTSQNFTIFANIDANFYSDPNAQAELIGGVCQLTGAAGQTTGTGANFYAEGMYGSYTGTITGDDGRVAVPFWPAPADNIVTLNPGDFDTDQPYICMCPEDCQYSGIASPQSGLNFYLTEIDLRHSAWYQTIGGNIYATSNAGIAANDPIPVTTCDPEATCISNIVTKDLDISDDSAGIVLTGGGDIDSSDEDGIQTGYITERDTQAFALGTINNNLRENYDYFYKEFGMGITPADDFPNPLDANKPSLAPAGDKNAYYHNGYLTILDAWNVAAGESIVVFVDGDLNIADPDGLQQLITVEPGGFLAFIVSGDINIAESVGNDDLNDTTPNIEGVYIADGYINTQSRGVAAGGDDRFVGAGTFVGWTGVNLERDFEDDAIRKAENNVRPAELFIFRPDFVVNVPERMTKSRYIWQEAN